MKNFFGGHKSNSRLFQMSQLIRNTRKKKTKVRLHIISRITLQQLTKIHFIYFKRTHKISQPVNYKNMAH